MYDFAEGNKDLADLLGGKGANLAEMTNLGLPVHSRGTVPAHGVDELAHPEPGFYAIGVKSYGRAPTFLMATGYEQARSVVAALAGDWAAAREVRLDLPETGVCNSNQPVDSYRIEAGGGCCGTTTTEAAAPAVRGLATGIAGGLLSAPVAAAAGCWTGGARAGRRLLRVGPCGTGMRR